MKNIKIKATSWDLVVSPKREANTETSWNKGVEPMNICGCCGKELTGARHSLRLIEGGEYFTEYEGQLEESSDMGWFLVGNTCYKKFLKNATEIEASL